MTRDEGRVIAIVAMQLSRSGIPLKRIAKASNVRTSELRVLMWRHRAELVAVKS